MGEAVSLPVRDGAFDVALANLVLSHVPRYDVALRDMACGLRPDGRLRVTAWGRRQSALNRLWREVAVSFVAGGALDATAARFLSQALDDVAWNRFRERPAAAFLSRFGSTVDYQDEVLPAVGVR